jgi:hypothetical protein
LRPVVPSVAECRRVSPRVRQGYAECRQGCAEWCRVWPSGAECGRVVSWVRKVASWVRMVGVKRPKIMKGTQETMHVGEDLRV